MLIVNTVSYFVEDWACFAGPDTATYIHILPHVEVTSATINLSSL